MDDVAKGLSEAQANTLINVAAFLDVAAGQGIGVQVNKRDGGNVQLFADDLVVALATAFGLTIGDGKLAFRDAVRDYLRSKQP